MGKKKVKRGAKRCKDRLSRLPDELIHKILSFVDAKVAVQTSVLSKRWRFIWPTLPFLNFGGYANSPPHSTYMFIHHVLSNRYHRASISELNLCVLGNECVFENQRDGCLVEKFVEYAIAHNVECLSLELLYEHEAYKLSTFSSKSLKKLTLQVDLEEFSDIWDLPVLTTLHLSPSGLNNERLRISDSYLTCLPALTSLSLQNCDLDVSFSFNLPNLTTLSLFRCGWPRKVWNFPALLTLELELTCPKNIEHIFSTLVNLKNLTLSLRSLLLSRSLPLQRDDLLLSCPQLLNLNLKSRHTYFPYYNIVILAPKLHTFTSVGIFSITFGIPELENVHLKLKGWFEDVRCENKEKYYLRFAHMLLGLGSAKNVSFDLASIEALSAISNFLASFPSPFYNLKRVKLPRGYKESSMSTVLRSYLLGASPRATIVRTLSQDNMISQTAAVSMTAQIEVIEEPLATATKELVNCQYVNKGMCSDTRNMMVQERHMVGNPVLDANRVSQINSLTEGTSDDRGSSSKKNEDFGIWRGHVVNSEFVHLLDHILLKHPETFKHFSSKSKKLCTMNLNMLCTSLNDFTKISMAEVDSEMIVEYKDVYAYLQNQGFDVSWVVNRLDYIEQLRFSKPLIPELHAIDRCIIYAKSEVKDLQAHVDDAKTKLQDVQTLHMEKIPEIEKAFGTMGAKLAVGFIGDDLLSGP